MCNIMLNFKGDTCTERKTYYLMVLKYVNIIKWEGGGGVILYTVVSKTNSGHINKLIYLCIKKLALI